KEFPEQPLTFDVDPDSLKAVISTGNGQFSIVGQSGEDFPQLPSIKEEQQNAVRVGADLLFDGINKTLFASAEDELRPVMNGVYIDLTADNITFVASDAHKLVRYIRTDAKPGVDASFILPKKPSSLLKNVLLKEEGDVNITFDDKNAYFEMANYRLICRLVEGNYPSYNSVIPTENNNSLIIDRVELYNSLRRVSVYSNQASNLVKLKINGNQVTVSAQDIDFSISAYERLNCQFDGDDMEIGFKSAFLIEILSNISSSDVKVALSDPSRAGLFMPAENEEENEDVLMLLMPMMIGS
ncbi:MAG TPA: DNA polymerase III subunit beta, partial [Bacteroidales bacterium]|nr:DNA polymerase III subunit beta [Bacteroidales bacterium]